MTPETRPLTRSTEWIGNIQTLRFLAALWVFLFHLSFAEYFGSGIPLLDGFISMGFAGVDLFFVISGYVMAMTTAELSPGWRSAGSFMSARLIRIYSGWWPYFLAYWLWCAFNGQLTETVNLLGSFFLWPLYLQNYLHPITWTLSFELYFYAALALIYLFTRRHAALLLLVLGVVLTIANIRFYQAGIFTPEGARHASRWHNFYAYALVLEFIMGYLLGSTRAWHRPRLLIPALLGLIGLGACAYLYQHSGQLNPSGIAGFYHTPERVLLLGGASVCLVLLASVLHAMGHSPFKTLQSMGDASYSLYLGHSLVMGLFGWLLAWTHTPMREKGGLTLAVIFATVLTTWVVARFVERPLNRWGRRMLQKVTPPTAFTMPPRGRPGA